MQRKIYDWIYWGFINALTRLGVRVFYREIEVVGKENTKLSQGHFFAANHQNTLMDPVLVGIFLDSHPSFLTRADVFTSGIIQKIFDILKMLPIYRQRDGVDVIKKNEEIFRICIERLQNKEGIIIFPEGSHEKRHRLRILKKGLPRMVFQAAEENNFELAPQIVPVAVNYANYTEFRSAIHVHYGEAIDTSKYFDLYKENPSRALIKLRDEVWKGIEANLIHISDKENYDLINDLREWSVVDILKEEGNAKPSYGDTARKSKELIPLIEASLKEGSISEDLKKGHQEYRAFLQETDLRDASLREGPYSAPSVNIKAFGLLLSMPFNLIGLFLNYPIWKLADWLPKAKFKDDAFYASVRLVIGQFGFFFYYLILGLLVGLISWNWMWGVGIVLACIVFGMWSIWHLQWKRTYIQQRLYLKYKEELGSILPIREKLVSFVKSLTKEPVSNL